MGSVKHYVEIRITTRQVQACIFPCRCPIVGGVNQASGKIRADASGHDDVVVQALKARWLDLAAKENMPNTPKVTRELDNLTEAIRKMEHGGGVKGGV